MVRLLVTIFLAIFLVSCGEGSSDGAVSIDKDRCTITGFYRDHVCDVSMYELIANQKSYGNVVIRVRGYFVARNEEGGVKRNVLFISEEAAHLSDYAAAIELGEISGSIDQERKDIYRDQMELSNRHVFAVGTYSNKSRSIANGRRLAGTLNPIYGIGSIVPEPINRN